MGSTGYNHFAMDLYTTDEPIYALATAYAPSALAVIRTSGDDSVSLLSPFFSAPGRLEKAKSGMLVHGHLIDKEGKRVDEVVIAVYRKGHGYTSEEACEIMCHGSLVVISRICLLLEDASFRKALPGEFTYRAFMHGRMDLTQAEAVEELIRSKSTIGQQRALDRLDGNLSSLLSSVRERLLLILASLEVQLDYAEDEIPEEWVFPEAEVKEILSVLRSLSESYNAARLNRDGAKVVLAGAANAGKSSLFNYLVKEERAIVSDIPGTTRDYIECWCELAGLPVHLYDTAGLRESGDVIENEGIRRTENLMEDADLVIYLVDPESAAPSVPEADNTIVVWSKSDRIRKEGLTISTVTGEGVGALLDEVVRRLKARSFQGDGIVIDSQRQKEEIDETISALEEVMKIQDESYDIIALYFQQALSAIGRITGEVTGEELLDTLFSRFCVGK